MCGIHLKLYPSIRPACSNSNDGVTIRRTVHGANSVCISSLLCVPDVHPNSSSWISYDLILLTAYDLIPYRSLRMVNCIKTPDLLYFILSFLSKKCINAYLSRMKLYRGSKLVVLGASYVHTILQ